MTKLVYGVGVNDANYKTQPVINGRQFKCPFYVVWRNMLERCYSSKAQDRRPSYVGCTVHHDWLIFSKFKAWMEMQNWKGNQLDKDILSNGVKVYSADTCAFISPITNNFILTVKPKNKNYPTGVSWCIRDKKFKSSCSNPFTNKNETIGYFSCENEAHLAWRKRKHQHAIELSKIQSDKRVAEKLLTMYL